MRWLSLLVVAGCSSRDVPACRRICHDQFGLSPSDCEMLCTTSCTDIRDRIALRVEICEWLQRGGIGEPP
jgi:hypothetical protein